MRKAKQSETKQLDPMVTLIALKYGVSFTGDFAFLNINRLIDAGENGGYALAAIEAGDVENAYYRAMYAAHSAMMTLDPDAEWAK